MGAGTTTERSITVDPKVTLNLCVTQGTVSVNGWSRNEVRAFVKDGSNFAFRIHEKSRDGNPVMISLTSLRSLPSGTISASGCLAAEEIEIDVPENAALSIKGQSTKTNLDTLRKVGITTAGGDVSIRNVAQGIRARTFEGDIVVENSEGLISLETSSGNIVVSGVGPSEVGDSLIAKTAGGRISLQKMRYRLADLNSVSGSVVFVGELLSGGSFNFNTTNGAIRLLIPQNSSCKVSATYSYGNFNSDIPIKIETQDIHPGSVKTVVGTIGAGDCALRLSTSSGAIAIRKQQP